MGRCAADEVSAQNAAAQLGTRCTFVCVDRPVPKVLHQQEGYEWTQSLPAVAGSQPQCVRLSQPSPCLVAGGGHRLTGGVCSRPLPESCSGLLPRLLATWDAAGLRASRCQGAVRLRTAPAQAARARAVLPVAPSRQPRRRQPGQRQPWPPPDLTSRPPPLQSGSC